MKRKLYSLIVAFSLIFATSCDLDLLDSPNVVTANTANPTLILNNVQLSYAGMFNTLSTFGMRVTRVTSQPNVNYANAYFAQTFNGTWNTAYASILNDIKFIEELNAANPVPRHVAIAKVIKAMVLMNLVDYLGDVPLTEALDPNNFNPKVDPASGVYQAAFAELQAAKALFATATANLPQDFFYNNNVGRWQKAINTLELRYHLNRRLVDEAGSRAAINALISGGNLIAPGDDFVFKYGTNLTNPDSRSPRYSQYGQGGGDYQGTWYMFHLTEAKGFDDPRVRYYLYRQVKTNPTDPDLLRCLGEIAPGHYLAGGFPFCLPNMVDGRGYWGRDHLNNEGIPPDGFGRTVFGLYPAGGRFDEDSALPVNSPTMGAGGAGVQPIMLAAYVDFMLAEAAQTLGTAGDAKALTLSGVRKHMNYVRSYALSTAEAGVVTSFFPNAQWNSLVDNYVNYVSNEWDDAPAGRKMNLIAREYWLSLFGNGLEAYNLYRRTGQPDGMQPALAVDPGLFPRSFLYPNDFVVTNRFATQKPDLGQRVFWDTNPAGNGWVN
ncbi:MAG: SusD/RagB family nutrient-binding outer membrane lipoprotein [Mongoliitalea sp.]